MSLGIFSRKSQTLLGVDIGTSSVKIVEVTRAGNKAILSNYGQSHIDRKSHSESRKIRNAETVRHIQDILSQANMKSRIAVVGIPAFSSFSTIIDLPRMPDQELEQAVISEARKYIPIPLAEVQLDWMAIPFLSNEKTVKALTVAVPNDVINRYSSIINQSGLQIQAVELETFSLARSLVGENLDSVLIVDIGSRSTNISISEKGIVPVHHNMDISGSAFTRAIARGLNIDFERAAKMKRSEGLIGEEQVRGLLLASLNPIMIEIQRIVQDYQQQGGTTPVSIVLSGGAAFLPGLPQYISQELSIPAHLGEPFRSLSYPKELGEVTKEIGPSFSVAVGLALRKV